MVALVLKIVNLELNIWFVSLSVAYSSISISGPNPNRNRYDPLASDADEQDKEGGSDRNHVNAAGDAPPHKSEKVNGERDSGESRWHCLRVLAPNLT